jgi:hypothetical protein
MTPEDYCPPGLGKTLEDLISKHCPKEKPTTELDIHIKRAAETRRLMAQMQGKITSDERDFRASRSLKPERPKKPAYPKRKLEQRGMGKKAYEWAVANGKSAREAADHFNIPMPLIHSHRRYNSLPCLKDSRVNTGAYAAMRAIKSDIRARCVVAYEEIGHQGRITYEAAAKHGLTYLSLIRFCIRNKLPYST